MFGYVVANKDALSEEEFARYKACYCGLCESIRRRHGELAGLTLTYDLAFIPLLLGALYEPEEVRCSARCIMHPIKAQPHWNSEYTDYAADMNVLLSYYKLCDDWHDEHDVFRLGAAQTLKSAVRKIGDQYPRQSKAIQDCLASLSRTEAENLPNPDEAAHWFGVLMGELFVLKEDENAETLRRLGYFLGKFIYIQDASIDLEKDIRHERYNPLVFLSTKDHRPMLNLLIGSASEQLEKLELKRDEHILKNIIYSGVWTKFELVQAEKARRKEKHKA